MTTRRFTLDDIAVVIPVLNEADGIAAAIESVCDAGQIIIVDGGSSDSTLEIARSFANQKTLVISSQRGRGHQLSVGAKQSDHAILLFLHGDCRLLTNSLDTVVEALGNGYSWGAMQQRIDRQSKGFTAQKYRLLEYGNALRVKILGVPFGDQAMFMLADLYRVVGGFEEIPLMEDLRLSKRLRRRVWPVLVDGTVVVSPRRWEKRGIIRQTLRNWTIQSLHGLGMPLEILSRLYK